ncbi:uncharacterized protein LOC117579699 [Drosophila guanche]|uniref:Secreted protein n=1 Tax=Drosophila guanche TaxID=7266 RepID=A0A3B0K119_DROGU|nr:uncharacterized protein LOC117579699 [Drosophila guanche]SPP77068.1 Hypothetical predicted protein [Drosophila guanche]
MKLLPLLVLLAVLPSCHLQTRKAKRYVKRRRFKTTTQGTTEEDSSSYPPFTSQPTEPDPVNVSDVSDEDMERIAKDLCSEPSYGCFMNIVANLRRDCHNFLESLISCEDSEENSEEKGKNKTSSRRSTTTKRSINLKRGKHKLAKQVMWNVIKRTKAVNACDTPFGFFPYPDCLAKLVPQLADLINAVKELVPNAVLIVFGNEPECVKRAFYQVICMALLTPGNIFYCTIKAMFGH